MAVGFGGGFSGPLPYYITVYAWFWNFAKILLMSKLKTQELKSQYFSDPSFAILYNIYWWLIEYIWNLISSKGKQKLLLNGFRSLFWENAISIGMAIFSEKFKHVWKHRKEQFLSCLHPNYKLSFTGCIRPSLLVFPSAVLMVKRNWCTNLQFILLDQSCCFFLLSLRGVLWVM